MKPILFNDEMVRAILDGRKTQTRRAVTPQPHTEWYYDAYGNAEEAQFWRYGDREDWPWPSDCPLGKPGDRLWVRESGKVIAARHPVGGEAAALKVQYRADGAVTDWMPLPKRMGADLPSWALKFHHVPNGVFREASRITLEITDVRVQRLQDIPTADVWAEGLSYIAGEEPGWDAFSNVEDRFADAWDATAKPGAKWDDDPWVWAISFKRVEV